MAFELIMGLSRAQESTQRQKGQSLLSFPDDYTIIDLETTGMNPKFDDIIEIACIRFRNAQEVARYTTLVRPERLISDDEGNFSFIDDFIEELTGITNDMLQDAPTFQEIADEVWNFLNGEILVGHNIHFDLNFLYDNFLRVLNRPLRNDFVDTLRLSRRVFPDRKKHTLPSLASDLHITNTFHRALADCFTTQSLLQIMKEKAETEKITFTPHKRIDLSSLSSDGASIVPDHLFFQKHCTFTGKLERFSRKEAAQIVVDIGGLCDNSVTQNTNFLIVGNFDFVSSVKNGKSSKIKRAEELILKKHQDLKILSEDTFYDLISDIIRE